MEYSIHIDTISMALIILYFEGSQIDISMSLKMGFILANSANSYRISPYDAFIWAFSVCQGPGLEVIKLEFILKLKIKRNDWLLVDTCSQATNHCPLF